MITTKDVNLKETKPRKLKMITTKTIDAAQFKVKGKPKQTGGPIITTSNYEKFLRKKKK